MEESQRQKKVAGVLQEDLAEILQRAAIDGGLKGVIMSVSKVRVTVDLSIAKVYLSIFPTDKGEELLDGIRSNKALIRHEMSQRTRHQMRRMPELLFYLDDTLEYIQNIEDSLEGKDNPIENRDLLDKRKKK
jgi:ribosome-binding factor A